MNNLRSALGLFLSLFVLNNLGNQVDASQATSSIVAANDLRETASNEYVIVGDDPYLVMDIAPANGDGLLLDLSLSAASKVIQVFFKNLDQETQRFDPNYLLSYNALNQPFVAQLPAGISLSNKRIRVDFVACDGCEVTLNGPPRMGSTDADIPSVEANEFQNGLSRLSQENSNIPVDNWRLNALSGMPSEFSIEDHDPFLVSPKLNVSTHDLGGVHFELNVPQSSDAYSDFQLFYATENHNFVESANTSFRIAIDQIGITQFTLPLSFLSQELPSQGNLKRLRLDLPLIPDTWALNAVSLIHKEQMPNYQSTIPTRLVQNKRQRAASLSMVKKVLLNISADLGFVIGYILLLLLVAVGFTRAYRR